MAGIGFELQKVLDKDKSYFNKFNVALKSMFITSGPWIISIITLLLIKIFVSDITNKDIFISFLNVLVYSFIFSMIISSPFINVITRYLSDLIYIEKFDRIFPLFISSSIVIGGLSFGISALYIFFFTNLVEFIVNISAMFAALSILWLIMVFVSTLRNYNLVTYSFLFGMLISFILLYFVLNNSLNELLQGFTIGILITISILMAKLNFDFKNDITFDFKFLFLKKYIPLFLSGFLFYLAIWIDKFVYWFSNKGVELTEGFFFFPQYDFVIFIAYLIIIPTTAYFTIYVETTFYEHQRNYFSAIENKKTLSVIKNYEKELQNSFLKGLINVSIFQFTIALFFILSLQYFLDSSTLNIGSIPILRIVVLAVSLQMVLNVLIIFLYYFDYQKEVLIISTIYLILNFSLTLFYKDFGFEYVGYSFFYSTLITLFLSLIIAMYKIDKINFYTFTNNEV